MHRGLARPIRGARKPPGGRYAAPLVTLTMRPPPRASIPGTTARQHRNTPRTLISNTCHHDAGCSWSKVTVGPCTPALLTSRSTGPACSNQRTTSSSCETSPVSVCPPISVATASIRAAVRPVTQTSIPTSASPRAMFAPTPLPPPVTRATRPSSDPGTDLLEVLRIVKR